MIGRKLGQYEILDKLGQGGMGEVYRARDTRLRRDVALKVIGDSLKQDPVAQARFRREARAVAALNHPNIVTLFSVEDAEGIDFLTMELVEGAPLSSEIAPGGLPLDRALNLAIQLADALAVAREQGITHRDLKPANIMVTRRGQAKILDFGLARSLHSEGAADATMQDGAPTITRPGLLMGTVAYMSPEQVEGEQADHRSDIFSLGVVLYELATGQRPFQGKTSAAVIGAILRDSPQPATALRPELPEALSRAIARCLEKDPAGRYARAGELEAELRLMRQQLESGLETPAHSLPAPAAGRAADLDSNSIAVLPLSDLSPSGDQEYFCDGIAEEIINALSAVHGLRVAARTSSFRFKGTDADVRAIGADLNVRLVLEGSVRTAGNRLRVSAQLVNVSDGFQLWSERYDRLMEDVFEVQDEISVAIVDALKGRIAGIDSGPIRAPRRQTENVDAYHDYLRGRHCWNRRQQGTLPRAIEYFRSALDRDPNYALAYSGLADCYNVLGFYGFEAPERTFARAKSAAEKALAIDPGLGEAHASVGYVQHHFDHDWERAEGSFRQAILLRPDYAVSHQWLGIFLASRGRHDEALQQVLLARGLDPLSPVIATAVGCVLHLAGDDERAASELAAALDLDPAFPWLRYVTGQVHERAGRSDDARIHFQAAVDATDDAAFFLAGLGHALGRAGNTDEARKLLARLETLRASGYVSALDFALVHCGLGEFDAAERWLERAHEERAATLVYIDVDPRFAELRG